MIHFAQRRVAAWVLEVLGPESLSNPKERALRFVEEAIELAQACSLDAETLHKLVDYVMQRPVGDPEKEIGGCFITLYAVAEAIDADADAAFTRELKRVRNPEVIERVRRRQQEKREALIAEPRKDEAREDGSKDDRERPASP